MLRCLRKPHWTEVMSLLFSRYQTSLLLIKRSIILHIQLVSAIATSCYNDFEKRINQNTAASTRQRLVTSRCAGGGGSAPTADSETSGSPSDASSAGSDSEKPCRPGRRPAESNSVTTTQMSRSTSASPSPRVIGEIVKATAEALRTLPIGSVTEPLSFVGLCYMMVFIGLW